MDVSQALQNAVISIQNEVSGSPNVAQGDAATSGNAVVLEMFGINDKIPAKEVSSRASEIYDWALKRTGNEVKAVNELKRIKHKLGSQADLEKAYRYVRLRSEVSEKIGVLQAMED